MIGTENPYTYSDFENIMYYHASPTGRIERLESRVSEHGIPLVYLSSKRENVLVYLSNAVEKYCRETGFAYDGKYTKWGPYGFDERGILRLEEYYPHSIEKTYKGVAGYIYRAEAVVEADCATGIPYAVVSSRPVAVTAVEYVPDAYEAIVQAAREGLITIRRYEDMLAEKHAWIAKTVREEYANAAKQPEYTHFLKGNFPNVIFD